MRLGRILLVLPTLAMITCAPASQRTQIRVGYMPFASDLPLFVAIENGYFAEARIKPQLVRFQAANENMNALLTGKLDFTGMIGLPTLFTIFEKDSTSFRMFLPAAETERRYASFILVRPGLDADSLADLRGKRIGTYSGTTQLLNLRSILQSTMDPEKDVTIIQVQAPLQLSALESGQFDALYTIEPYATTAIRKGIARVLVDNPRCRYILCPFPVIASTVRMEFARSQPDVTRRVIAALVRGMDFARQHEPEARRMLEKYADVDSTVAAEMGLYEWWGENEADHAAVQQLADLFLKQEVLKMRINTKRMFLPEPPW